MQNTAAIRSSLTELPSVLLQHSVPLDRVVVENLFLGEGGRTHAAEFWIVDLEIFSGRCW